MKVRMLKPRLRQAKGNEYERGVFLPAGDYLVDNEYKGLGYVVFTDRGLKNRTIITYEEGGLL